MAARRRRAAADLASPIAVGDGRSIYIDGSAAVTFTIDQDRTSLSELLVRHFADNGWLQRATQYMNPHLSTSFAQRWRMLPVGVLTLDSRGTPVKRDPYGWTGEWENNRGELVYYSLHSEWREIRGYAAYVPRSSVDLTRTRSGVSCVDIETRAPVAAGQSFTSPIGKGLEAAARLAHAALRDASVGLNGDEIAQQARGTLDLWITAFRATETGDALAWISGRGRACQP